MSSTLTKIFWAIWTMISLLVIAAWTTDMEITNGLIDKGFTCISIFGLVKIVTTKLPWTLTKKLIISTVVFGLFLIFKLLTDWGGDWKTQTIYFQNNHFSNRTIEFQMKDIGAFGYKRRTVDRIKLFPFISWTIELTPEELKDIDTLTWDKVNIETNELGLKGG